MPTNRFSLSKLRLEDVKEAKRNLPLWDGSDTKFQSWHNAFLHLAYCLNVSDFLTGSAIFPASFGSLTLRDSSPLRFVATPIDVDSDSDSENEETLIFPVDTQHTPRTAITGVSPSKVSLHDDDISSVGSVTTQRASLATLVNGTT